MTASMWTIPNTQNIRTPLSILKEQGDFLSSQSGGDLIGQVATFGNGNDIRTEFRIIIPILGNYNYTAIIYFQAVTSIYPGQLISIVQNNFRRDISDENEFKKALQDIIASAEMSALLTSLLAQARAAKG